MHFKHPELLYGLLLLVIPVLVHLFQLRRFRTEMFTNVKFLKKAVLQTRKSSRIKKWLILFTRLFLLAALIIAFAQPFFASSAKEKKLQETVVYLDNSYSMQAKGKSGVLLRQGVQQLLENLPTEGEVSFFTNSEQYKNITTASLREKLQEISYSPRQLPWKTISLKAQGLFTGTDSIGKNFIAISDFQQQKEEAPLTPLPDARTFLVPTRPESSNNISLDSVYVTANTPGEIKLTVLLSSSEKQTQEVPVGLYNGNKLLSRKTTGFEDDLSSSLVFSLPSGAIEKGRLSIEDNGLSFDNQLFFSINPPDAIEVVVIGDSEIDFLRRIFTSPEFDLQAFPENNVDYNRLSRANLVILNEVKSIPFSLKNELQKLHKENVFLVIIPSKEADLASYNSFFKELGLPVFRELVEGERLITGIAFSHPVYAPVFDEKVQNFQYPAVQSTFGTGKAQRAVLNYDNGQPFLLEKDNIYVFSAPINTQNSNFQGSPLIVPTFFNIGNLTVSLSQLYYILGEDQTISLQARLGQDEIVKLNSSEYSFIPRQQSFQNKVELYLEDDLREPGHYEVLKDSVALRTLAFNADRSESNLVFQDLNAADGLMIQQNIPEVFEEIKATGEVAALWKWFVIFALILLLTEMLILKFFK